MKSFRAISRVKRLYETDVSRTISVRIIPIMRTEMVLETSVSSRRLTRLIAREDFIKGKVVPVL
jgi:hypothetical protein